MINLRRVFVVTLFFLTLGLLTVILFRPDERDMLVKICKNIVNKKPRYTKAHSVL